MPTTGFEKRALPALLSTQNGHDIRIEGSIEPGSPVEMVLDGETRIQVGFVDKATGPYGSVTIGVYPQYAHLFGKTAPGIFKEFSVTDDEFEAVLDPNPWLDVDKHTRAARHLPHPQRSSLWRPREGYEQDPEKYSWETLSYPKDRYAVRRAMAAMSQRGYRQTPIAFPPPWGYYVTNPDAAVPGNRMQAVVDTQKILHERFHVSGTYDQRDVALYDAVRAFYEYTDPFGVKTYA